MGVSTKYLHSVKCLNRPCSALARKHKNAIVHVPNDAWVNCLHCIKALRSRSKGWHKIFWERRYNVVRATRKTGMAFKKVAPLTVQATRRVQ